MSLPTMIFTMELYFSITLICPISKEKNLISSRNLVSFLLKFVPYNISTYSNSKYCLWQISVTHTMSRTNKYTLSCDTLRKYFPIASIYCSIVSMGLQ